MRALIFLILSVFSFKCNVVKEKYRDYTTRHAFTQYPISKEINNDSIICFLRAVPEIDYEKWKQFLNDKLMFDSTSVDTIPTGRYTVFVQFAIAADGGIVEVLILKDPGYGLGKRVKDVFTNYKAKQDIFKSFESVKSYLRQPITFVIEKEQETQCKEGLSGEFIL